jgi:hypothetical protein
LKILFRAVSCDDCKYSDPGNMRSSIKKLASHSA